MDGANAGGGDGSSEGPTTGSEETALSGTSKTMPILLGILALFFPVLVAISYL